MAGPKYYPILKWKKGEQDAVRYLDTADQAVMLPVLEVLAKPGADLRSALGAQLERAHGDFFPFGIDGRNVWQAGSVFNPLLRLCAGLQKDGYLAYPVINVPDLFANLGNLAALKEFSIVILRLRLQLLTLVQAVKVIKDVRKAVGRKVQVHVIYDFGPIGDAPEPWLRGFVEPFVRDTLAGGDASFVSMAGGSFPLTLTGIPVGAQNKLRRKEWHVWQDLRLQLGCADVRFGDFTVTNPEPLEIADPAAMNPSAAIRYALDGEWWLLRGKGVKTAGAGGFGQYNTLCKLLVASPQYAGAPFSYGDGRYSFHAQPSQTKTGNLTTWRRDAANHHLVQTARRLNVLI
ncbi:hypothetical protein [Thermomonas sp.]|uniref:beta family protein n=1 Tax=Thermomonas sp. TaxID=1971895 RepID=UPI002488CA2D|nr:hypothetical protein [Thermomonas sp.]MDI1254133.1 hypothetical protein [Thermomonas sp.]